MCLSVLLDYCRRRLSSKFLCWYLHEISSVHIRRHQFPATFSQRYRVLTNATLSASRDQIGSSEKYDYSDHPGGKGWAGRIEITGAYRLRDGEIEGGTTVEFTD